MVKLNCSDYGFECDFAVEGEVENVLEKFGKHTDEETRDRLFQRVPDAVYSEKIINRHGMRTA